MPVTILNGHCLEVLKTLESESVNCCVTSPPYWGLRDYGVPGQIGLEPTIAEYLDIIGEVFQEVWRVLKKDGTLWLNLGDAYATGGYQPHNKGAIGNKKCPSGWTAKARGQGAMKTIGGTIKPKDLLGIPWRVAFTLQENGWYLRSDIVWSKPNPMPESVRDRPTKAHEYIFLLTKSPVYYYDNQAIREPLRDSSVARVMQDIENQEGSDRANGGQKTNGKMKAVIFGGNKSEGYGGRRYSGKEWNPKMAGGGSGISGHKGYFKEDGTPVCGSMANKKTVWNIPTVGLKEAHFATFPPKLIEPCILAGAPEGGTVLDPFFGAGTTGLVADRLNRNCIGIELNPGYINIAEKRIKEDSGLFAEVVRA